MLDKATHLDMRLEEEKHLSDTSTRIVIGSRWPSKFEVYFRIFDSLLFSFNLGLSTFF